MPPDPDVPPARRQYLDAKARHPGMLLFFRMGDFYELFDDDAEVGARVLGLTLTSRDKGIPMAGFPHHALETHLRTLIAAGHRAAICEQMEDAATVKGRPVNREVTRVVTAGTLTEDELLDPRRPNFLAAVVPGKHCVGLAWVDLSAGAFWAAEVPAERLGDELLRLSPAECLCPDHAVPALEETLRLALPRTVVHRPDWSFESQAAHTALHEHFHVKTLGGFGFTPGDNCTRAAGGLLIYLQETTRSGLGHLRALKPFRSEQFLMLDEVTRRSLELTRTLRDGGREGSLLESLDRTITPMGARLLHDWLIAPLAERGPIDARLEAVSELHDHLTWRNELRDLLGEAFDLQRLTARVSTGRATPRDLAAVGKTLRLLPRLKAKLAGRRSALIGDIDGRLELCPDLREALDAALVDHPPVSSLDGGIIQPGYDAELDRQRSLVADGKTWMAQYQAKESLRTGIGSLKVGFNSVFGYYLEITHTHGTKVPPEYVRKQTLKNAERYITGELKEYEEQVLGAEDRAKTLELQLFMRLREQVAAQTPRLLAAADTLATLDVLASLADLAASRGYCRPTMDERPVLHVVQGRHPVLDQTLPPGTFVPNDIALSPDNGHFWLITGPNMSGKSIFIRQVALVTLLAHMGSFVPATSARVGMTDRIFTRVGASDELSRGQSTFMVEMTEAANILNNATARSLVILDEIGRGTSTYDGVSLAWAIAEYLHTGVGCRSLFATHYHELAQLADSLPGLRNHNVQVQEEAGGILFLHRIAPGSASKSYGIHVARIAGVPRPVWQRAQDVLAELESHHRLNAGPTTVPADLPERRRRRERTKGPSLFECGE